MKRTLTLAALALLATGARAGAVSPTPAPSRCFELRTYTAAAGKLDALHARFRDHTNALFEKHGMTLLGFWVPRDKDKGADNTLVYMLAFPDCAAREKAWQEFRADPEWIKVRESSEAAGKIVEKTESVLLTPTDYSPLK